jgi:hypothetical protein
MTYEPKIDQPVAVRASVVKVGEHAAGVPFTGVRLEGFDTADTWCYPIGSNSIAPWASAEEWEAIRRLVEADTADLEPSMLDDDGAAAIDADPVQRARANALTDLYLMRARMGWK